MNKNYMTCISCLESKPLNEFTINSRSRDGYNHVCNLCRKESYEKRKIDKEKEFNKKLINPNWRTKSEWAGWPMSLRVYRCENCKKDYTPKIANSRFCSSECRGMYTFHGPFNIFERDNFRCVYCGKSSIEDMIKLHIDHIIPKSKNGEDVAKNLVTSCQRCNLEKSAKILSDELVRRIQEIVNQRNLQNNILPDTKIKLLNKR